MIFPLRLAISGAFLLAAVLVLAGVWQGAAWLPPCLFHEVTGLDCPGCGLTRACSDALHGRFWQAFQHNPLGVILTPLAVVAMSVMLGQWLLGRPVRAPFGNGWARGILALVLLFWVLRNVPGFEFLGP
ncbi:MAG: DUF2752 domain-containing protein [Verrucomicrobiales bacterium]